MNHVQVYEEFQICCTFPALTIGTQYKYIFSIVIASIQSRLVWLVRVLLSAPLPQHFHV